MPARTVAVGIGLDHCCESATAIAVWDLRRGALTAPQVIDRMNGLSGLVAFGAGALLADCDGAAYVLRPTRDVSGSAT